MDAAKVKKIKEIVERLKAKKKKHKVHVKGAKTKHDESSESKHQGSKRTHGPARKPKPKAVMQGPHGGEYVVLGNGKKKYGVSKSMVEEFVKEEEMKDFLKKHKGEK